MLTLQCAIPPVVFIVTLVPFELEQLELVRHPLIEAMINMVSPAHKVFRFSEHVAFAIGGEYLEQTITRKNVIVQHISIP